MTFLYQSLGFMDSLQGNEHSAQIRD
jgi:hypothetical protein